MNARVIGLALAAFVAGVLWGRQWRAPGDEPAAGGRAEAVEGSGSSKPAVRPAPAIERPGIAHTGTDHTGTARAGTERSDSDRTATEPATTDRRSPAAVGATSAAALAQPAPEALQLDACFDHTSYQGARFLLKLNDGQGGAEVTTLGAEFLTAAERRCVQKTARRWSRTRGDASELVVEVVL